VSVVRPPVIAGLTPDSGTSTLAAALHACDAGVLAHRVAGEADIVVCRAHALRHATALACAASGPRPVLAVVLEPAGPDAVAQRLASVRTRFGAVVALPHVPQWHGRTGVQEEAAAVLGLHSGHLAGPVRAYAAALRVLVTALADSGVLRRTAPPMVSRPSTGGLWPGLRTAERIDPPLPAPRAAPPPAGPGPARPAELPGPAPVELDDEALEALLHGPPVPADQAG
jgi:hypothetical protein